MEEAREAGASKKLPGANRSLNVRNTAFNSFAQLFTLCIRISKSSSTKRRPLELKTKNLENLNHFIG